MSDLSSDVCSSDLWTTDNDAVQQTLRAGRLQKLKHLGLAEEVRPGEWRLAGGLEETLKRMGERGDIIKTMHREMTEKGVTRAHALERDRKSTRLNSSH